jgi:sensor c-di-GMP phosphodiesterase-like protein
VVAEGVENTDQAVALRQFGCRTAQGFLFSPPVGADVIDDWLTTTRPFAPHLAGSTGAEGTVSAPPARR